MKSVTGENDMVVFGQGTDEDNQNEAVYNAIRTYLDVLQGTMQDEQIFTPDNTLFKDMFEKLNANKEYDSENPAQNLYHFLETIDEAKAKTIKQMNFLRLVSGDLNKLAVDILEKDKEIEAHKEKIRRSNHLTDADSSKEKELFSKNEYLKQLEKEKKELKERYESIVNGESAG